MRRLAIFIFISVVAFGCKNGNEQPKTEEMTDNVLLKPFDTPYGVPPFDKIKESDYLPAFKEAIAQQKAEIEAIIRSKEAPTFENTIEALENGGTLLDNVSMVFFNLLESVSTPGMEKIAAEVQPMVTAAHDEIFMNDSLFQRVKTVYTTTDTSKLDIEQKMLLEETYKAFVRGGANLDETSKAKLKEINKKLGSLSLKFGQNVLAETNKFKMVIDKAEDLAGLPKSVVDAAAEEAKAAKLDGKWLFTTQKTSLIPFITYSSKRELREKIFKAYINKGDNNDSLDNKKLIVEIVNLRLEKAKLLGYKNYAAYVLEENMAKTPEKAMELMKNIISKSVVMAEKERKELQKLADEEKAGIKIEAWDWWYYTEKLRLKKYNLSEEELRPYFKLENVRDGMFDVATKLYGVSFKENKNLPVMHPDATAYEVIKNGQVMGILYADYFPRESKRGGAWMTEFRNQYIENGKNVIPIISMTMNFTKPTADKPSLLNWDEVTTLFHEFGHCLHGLMSNVKYESLAGTATPRDFVELPSQIMENWAGEPEVLKSYARHYQTNEPIPDELIKKIKDASKFNNGFTSAEFVAAAFLDMDWHSITEPFTGDVNEFEKASMAKIKLIPEIVVRYRSTFYNHIFSGGYEAGYYSYLWTAVLDADAFTAFTETSLFDAKTAQSFLDNVLSRGGTEDPALLYKRFRGRDPKIDAYLIRMGLK